MSGPATQPIATGWRARVNPRRAALRVRDSGNAIVQIVVAATAAYSVAHYGLGHATPLLAATVTVSSLGLARDARPRQIAENVGGLLLGILVAETLILVAGTGWWQIAVALGVSLVIGRFLSPQPGFAIAAGLQALIVTIIPAPAPFLRLIDGIIGGITALIVTALIPHNPIRTELRSARAVFAGFEGTTAAIVQALHRGDRFRAERGLEKARALTAPIEGWRESVESGIAIARISPFLRRQRFELQRHDRIRRSMDLAIRNLRVTARRVVYLCDDGTPRPIAADLVSEVARSAGLVAASLDDISFEPAAQDALRAVASRLDPRAILPAGSLGEHNFISGLRPLVVDLLTATGVPPAEARKAVPRI
ncbi:FUSC family protein [Microbacterium sp. AZCO]|uniref:FUSC family protein n=1 Tax=Microbacterium sp. AZCO TaxID=3142976 RepID=UPI0031F47937